jgi:hypothetical protein
MDIAEAWSAVVLLMLFWTAIAVVMVRQYTREIPFLILISTTLGSFVTVAVATVVIYNVFIRSGLLPIGALAILIFAAFCIPGTIISRLLKRRGVTRPFPGIGARVMAAIFAMQSILAVGYVWLSFPH